MNKKLLCLLCLCVVLLCAAFLASCNSPLDPISTTNPISTTDPMNTTAPLGTAIASASLRVDGDTLTGILPYDTEVFSFASDIVTAPGVTYTVCTDIMCRDTVPSKTVPVGSGDNIYYLLVSNGQSQKLYTVLLRRGERTTVRLDLRDGSAPLSVYATVGLPISDLPSPTLRGYLFTGWYRDVACTVKFGEADTAAYGMTLYAGWQIDPDARVSVTYYCQGQVWQTQQVPYGSVITPPTPPQTEENPFVGWYTADKQPADFSAPMVDDTEVTAVFASDMAVVCFYTADGQLYDSMTLLKGMCIPPLPDTIDGQDVTWCTADGGVFAPNTPIMADTDLYARTATVTYMIGEDLYHTTIIPLYTCAVPPADPELPGFAFMGWFAADADTAFDLENSLITTNIVLYARFVEIYTYTISYNLGEYEGVIDAEGRAIASNPNIAYLSSGEVWTEKSNLYYTIDKEVKIKPATAPNMLCTWYDQDGNVVTSTKGRAKNLELTAVWSKAPYINLDFEGMLIHYNDSKSGLPALDGTTQIYNNASGAASRPNAAIQYYYDVDDDGNIIQNFNYHVMDMFKNTHNPMYIRNDGDEHGDYFCIILDHDLTDGSQKETFYFDKDGTGPDHKSADANGTVYPGVYYDCAGREHYDVSALCYLQNNDITGQTVKLSFDFYFEEGGLFPISFYMRDDYKRYGKAFNGNRTNLAALMPNGNIAIGVDAVGNAGRLSYKDAEGNTITTEQVLGTANVGAWNHIEFTMKLAESGTNYEVTISLNGTVITASALNLYVGDLTWNHASMFMIFGGGGDTAYPVDALDRDLVYKFDNIKLVGVED